MLSRLPACSWSSGLDDPDRADAWWRAYVKCQDASGDTCNTPPSDPPSGQTSCGAGYTDCQDICAPNQYAVSCGGVGPTNIQAPPAGCTEIGANPGGSIEYCCPCQ